MLFTNRVYEDRHGRELALPANPFSSGIFPDLGRICRLFQGLRSMQRTSRDESSAVGALRTCTGKAKSVRFCRLTREISAGTNGQFMRTDEPQLGTSSCGQALPADSESSERQAQSLLQLRLRPELSDLACREAPATSKTAVKSLVVLSAKSLEALDEHRESDAQSTPDRSRVQRNFATRKSGRRTRCGREADGLRRIKFEDPRHRTREIVRIGPLGSRHVIEAGQAGSRPS